MKSRETINMVERGETVVYIFKKCVCCDDGDENGDYDDQNAFKIIINNTKTIIHSERKDVKKSYHSIPVQIHTIIKRSNWLIEDERERESK